MKKALLSVNSVFISLISTSLVSIMLVSIILFFLCYGYQALGVQTQVNEMNDLFNRHIEDKDALLKNMQKQNDSAMEQIASRVHHDSIEGIQRAEEKASELNSIKETDLEASGRQKRNSVEYQFYDENELEPDYTKPGNQMHKLDAEDIVKATEETMHKIGIDLMKRLITLGFNCKTVKGAVQKDAAYYIEIKREEQKNTEYDQFFCEELRNQYSCSDSLTLTCKEQGIRWGDWQNKEIHVPGKELFDFGKPVFWIDHTGKRCFEYKLVVGKRQIKFGILLPPDPVVVQGVREFLVTKHPGSTIENISDEMSSNWHGGIFSIGGWNYCGHHLGYKDHLWSTYVINYKYREGSNICLEWSEDWKEGCTLK